MTAPIQLLLESLAGCLCDRIKQSGNEVCFCGVIPGDMAVATYSSGCEDDRSGMAWVRLAGMYPASAVGQQDITVTSCRSGIGADIEVGILRQIPGTEDPNTVLVPTEEQMLEVADQTNSDAMTMYQAITCCDALEPKSYILGDWAPAGPLGLMVGGVWRLSVAI